MSGYSPKEVLTQGSALLEALDQDGPEPDDREPPPANWLQVRRNVTRPGGKLSGRYDDAAFFDAILTAIDAMSKPLDSDDNRDAPTRRAEALSDICGFVLDHAGNDVLSDAGGRRPHLNVHVDLVDLQNRARHAVLDLGGRLSPAALRTLCCDACVTPIVLNGAGQPLDVGRSQRTATTAIRSAVAARDRGCAKCGRPPSWCEVHHLTGWENGDITAVHTCVMLCKACHRLVRHTGWEARMNDHGLPEFIPPRWIDHQRRPRHRAQPQHLRF